MMSGSSSLMIRSIWIASRLRSLRSSVVLNASHIRSNSLLDQAPRLAPAHRFAGVGMLALLSSASVLSVALLEAVKYMPLNDDRYCPSRSWAGGTYVPRASNPAWRQPAETAAWFGSNWGP